MSGELHEPDLVARATQGDADAFGDLYALYLEDIYRYIFYRVSNHQDAEDLTERVFLKAWENMPRYRAGSTPFKAWIYRIAHNTVIDHYRTRKDSLPLSEIKTLRAWSVDPEDHVLSQEQIQHLAQTIQMLAPSEQHVLVLRFINGLSTGEIAAIMEKSEGAVRVLQYRALKSMQALLALPEKSNV